MGWGVIIAYSNYSNIYESAKNLRVHLSLTVSVGRPRWQAALSHTLYRSVACVLSSDFVASTRAWTVGPLLHRAAGQAPTEVLRSREDSNTSGRADHILRVYHTHSV